MRAQDNRVIQQDVKPGQPIARHGIRASQRIKISNSVAIWCVTSVYAQQWSLNWNSFVFQTIDRCHPCLKDLSDDRGAERERDGVDICAVPFYIRFVLKARWTVLLQRKGITLKLVTYSNLFWSNWIWVLYWPLHELLCTTKALSSGDKCIQLFHHFITFGISGVFWDRQHQTIRLRNAGWYVNVFILGSK